ncbi:MAG TPA: alpha-2-macroglobulin family protein, partial [Chitinophagaceae bacterium]|nr:alpha-2-macroglobulin family protein [Chitinophagaceae bacterium]
DAAGNASSGAEKKEESSRPAPQGIVARQNFNETAFFYPDLRTDAAGNITFSFTTPEALTRWKLQALAHTRDLAFGYSRQEIVTQKELMVQPNLPRFLRQGDRMELPVKVVNLSGKELTGQVELQLTDAATGNSVDGWFVNAFPNQYFTVAAGGSEVVRFPMEVPHQFQGVLQWKVIARSDSLSDGEASALPVLTNQVLVTETLPLPVRGTGTQTFRFEKLLNNTSETLQHQALTVEFTSNPAWYAVQALPYLAEPKNESSEAAWNRFYANALAAHIARSAPRVRAVFQQWKDRDTAALLSNLQKNEELKSALLQETPWVLEARTEAEQKRNLAVLFDLVRLGTELQAAFEKVKSAQAPNGGFVWFPGGPDDPQMTRHIVAGIGHLRKLGALPKELAPGLDRIVAAALPYLDKRVQERYQQLLKSKADLKKQAPEMDVLHYLYTRSFYPEVPVANGAKAAYAYYLSQAKTQWTNRTKYGQGLVALVLHRSGEVATAKAVLRSLKETSIVHEELGRYWKENDYGRGWYWWQAPVETQSLLVEAFAEAGGDAATADELRTWLLKNKQTNRWRTSKATAEACYALLLQGTDWLAAAPSVTVQLGAVTVNSAAEKTEEGTGYFRHRIEGARVQPAMGDIRVSVLPAPATGTAAPTATSWGAVYWQYFEDMNAVTAAATPLQLKKQLFVERATDRGPVLSPLTEGMALKVGDKVKVRIELRTDRSMEYLHLKDMRSSSFEPVNVLSGYRWQGGLGYYESTTDLATSFFIHHLPKGTFVFEYPVFVQHAGTFTNGITTIQSLYAPEFSAHSEGVPVRVE